MTQDALEPVSELPRGEFAFPGPLRDVLVQAILDGTKTATASLLIEYPKDYQFDEEVGSLEAVLDSHDNVVCIIRTTDMQVRRLADVGCEVSRHRSYGVSRFFVFGVPRGGVISLSFWL
ncbi:ASCH domain-containing protein [Corynebacterium mucifaciens]|uniref:Uncharacterized protein YhfF n=1 Tax=Corynebacterium mucifaciens TaxID=57171 RepID=A0ABV2NZL9_9CORY